MAISWAIDRHKYLSEVSRTALKVLTRHNITSQSNLQSQLDAEDEMADLGVYRTRSSAHGRISRALFTYFRSYGCLDSFEHLTETGKLFVEEGITVKEFALHYMLNYEHNGIYPLFLILKLFDKLILNYPQYAYIVSEDITEISNVKIIDETIVESIAKRHAGGIDTSQGNDGSDVWVWLLRQTGLFRKDLDKTLKLANPDLFHSLLSIYETSSFTCVRGKLLSGAMTGIPFLNVASSQSKLDGLITEANALRAFLFDGLTDEICTLYLSVNAESQFRLFRDKYGLPDFVRGFYKAYIGFEHLVGYRLLTSANITISSIGKALISLGSETVRNVEIPSGLSVRCKNELDNALKLFQRQRETDKPSGWNSFDEWSIAARTEFATADAAKLTAAGFDYADFARRFVYHPSVANKYFAAHTLAEKQEVGNFLARERNTPHAASWYIDASHAPKAPGVGPGVMLNFMMKLHPNEFCTYSSMISDMLKFVGLLSDDLPNDPTIEAYETSKSLQGQVLAKMHELGIGKTSTDNSPADYLTVNEFAWWISEKKNQEMVKEKIRSMEIKPVNSSATVIKGTRKLSDAFSNDDLLKRLAAALRTKPFAILAGHSGTGKSQLVRRLAYMTCNNQKLVDEGKDKTAPGNYLMVQVKPNWHDSTDLLGYYSDLGTRHFVNTPFVQFLCKAYAYPQTPFFLCLDEMNLAPVEQYFAEYLSAVESLEKKDGKWISDSLIDVTKTGEKDESGNFKVDEDILGQIMSGAQSTEAAEWIRKFGLTIPKNLFVVGTVNMDETTCQFSRKVLDRAMTLLMNEVKFSDMEKSKEPSEEELLDDDGIAFFMNGNRRGHVGAKEAEKLDAVNDSLENTAFVVAYRFANEYALYEEALANLNGLKKLGDNPTEEEKKTYWTEVEKCAEDALDHVVLMKLLPRIHGMKDFVCGIFEGRKIDEKEIPGLKEKVMAGGKSEAMMTEILKRGDEYLTFWP